jgi:hypothetical protein
MTLNRAVIATFNTATTTTLQNGVAVPNLSGSQGTQQYFRITVPAGQSRLTVSTTGGTGDADLYVRVGQLPATNAADCSSIESTTVETCTITNPAAGDWFILLRGFTSFSGVSLVATYTVTADPCNARTYTLGSSVPGALTTSSCPNFTHSDVYSYTTTATTFVNFRLTSTAFPPSMLPVVPPNSMAWVFSGSSPMDVPALIHAGTTSLIVTSSDTTKIGTYTLSSTPNPVITGCTNIATTMGVSASFALSTSSCSYPQLGTGFFAQPFYSNVPAGVTIRVTVTSTQFSPLVEIRASNGNLLATSAAQTGTTVVVTANVTTATYAPVIFVTSRTAGQVGTYTITIDP